MPLLSRYKEVLWLSIQSETPQGNGICLVVLPTGDVNVLYWDLGLGKWTIPDGRVYGYSDQIEDWAYLPDPP